MRILSFCSILVVALVGRSVVASEDHPTDEEDIDDEVHSIRFHRQTPYWKGMNRQTIATQAGYQQQVSAGGSNAANSWPTTGGQHYTNYPPPVPDCPPEAMEDEAREFGNEEFYNANKVQDFTDCNPLPSGGGWNDDGQQFTTTRRSVQRLTQAPTKPPNFGQEPNTYRTSSYFRPGTQAPPMPQYTTQATPKHDQFITHAPFWNPTPSYEQYTTHPQFWIPPAQTEQYPTQRQFSNPTPRYDQYTDQRHPQYSTEKQVGYTTQNQYDITTRKYVVPTQNQYEVTTRKYVEQDTQKPPYDFTTETPVQYSTKKQLSYGNVDSKFSSVSQAYHTTEPYMTTKRYPNDHNDETTATPDDYSSTLRYEQKQRVPEGGITESSEAKYVPYQDDRKANANSHAQVHLGNFAAPKVVGSIAVLILASVGSTALKLLL